MFRNIEESELDRRSGSMSQQHLFCQVEKIDIRSSKNCFVLLLAEIEVGVILERDAQFYL